jgi:hypothetical protein
VSSFKVASEVIWALGIPNFAIHFCRKDVAGQTFADAHGDIQAL